MKKKLQKYCKKILAVILTAILTAEVAGFTPVLAAAEPNLADGVQITRAQRVSVHDPSIVYGDDGYYYIFGSHMAWARSRNLADWSVFRTNINDSYRSIFAQPGTWAARGGAGYNIGDNLWAPDVIYNEKMGKWCMYMSVNGPDFCSVISLATADKITGPYTYVGNIVYSGFTNNASRSYTYTDYQKATGSTNISRYLVNGAWNSQYGTNAIDPCVRYDENGDLWMSYGSWFGGIYMLKLDASTGLRDYTYKYNTQTNKSDAYMGIKIAGGYGQSGEGSYIVYDKEAGYYYLYLSYCGLNATDDFSGYHLRMYRSKDITGPYTDAAGRPAVYTSAAENQSLHGIKLFGNYTFSSLKGNNENSANGYMSGGHNSAFIDKDGNHFLIYHTRFNVGQEWHEVRVHQQFLNEDGWPVTAPYEYRGSKISAAGYSKNEIVGSYELVNHGLASATQYTDMLYTLNVILMSDGTIAGDAGGTWSQKEGSCYASMNINGVDYKGVFFKQYDESASHKEVMTFSLIGEDNTSVWGSKTADDRALIELGIQSLFGGSVTGNIEIPSFGDAQVSFSTDSEYLKINSSQTKAVYKAPKEDTAATVTAKITMQGNTFTYTTKTLVKGYDNAEMQEHMTAYYDFEQSSPVTDVSLNKNHMTNYGVVKAQDKERGNVAYFNGNNSYMQLPASVTASDDFTFIAWVKSSETRAWERIFDFGDGEGNSLFLTSHGYTPESIRASYAVKDIEEQAHVVGPLVTEQWVNLAVTVDSVNMTLRLYINGEPVNTAASLKSKLTGDFKGTKNYLGKSQYSPDAYFKGYMDDVAIFNSVLSADEIQNFMNSGIEHETQTIGSQCSILVVSPGEYINITESKSGAEKVLSCVSRDESVAKICGGKKIRALSEGTAVIQAELADKTVKNITVRVEEEQDVAYGDVNRDGKIDVIDMEGIQRQILGLSKLDAAGTKAGSISSFNGVLSVRDMECIQKHILRIGTIIQLK